MCKLDLTKPVQTRDGKPARVIATDIRSAYPIVAVVSHPSREFVVVYTESGRSLRAGESNTDLVNVPPEPVVEYRNLYDDRHPGPWYSSIEDADILRATHLKRFAIHKRTTIGDEVTNEFIPV